MPQLPTHAAKHATPLAITTSREHNWRYPHGSVTAIVQSLHGHTSRYLPVLCCAKHETSTVSQPHSSRMRKQSTSVSARWLTAGNLRTAVTMPQSLPMRFSATAGRSVVDANGYMPFIFAHALATSAYVTLWCTTHVI